MLPLPLLAGPALTIAKLLALKVTAVTGFRFTENGLNWPATLEDLKRDHRVLTAIGSDTAKLIPAIVRLQRARSLEAVIRSAHDIKRAVEHLPEKTITGLNHSVGLHEIINAALGFALQKCGRAILKQQPKGEDASEALARHYLGLFLVGRGKGQLSERERTNVIFTLLSLHGMRKRKEDQTIADILQTWLPEKAYPLGEALVALREAFALQSFAPLTMFKVYITHALGGNVVPVNELDLLSDLTKRFPEKPVTTT